MNTELENTQSNARSFPATVAEVLGNGSRIVINRGTIDGVELSQEFLLYAISPHEIIDPETGESLGRLEIVKGTGYVIHVQEKMSIVKAVQKSMLLEAFMPKDKKEDARFFNPEIGDKVKPI